MEGPCRVFVLKVATCCQADGASCTQVYSTNLGQVVDIVVSHQAVALKAALVARLMAALVLPAPEHYRPLLRRLAALGAACLNLALCQCFRAG